MKSKRAPSVFVWILFKTETFVLDFIFLVLVSTLLALVGNAVADHSLCKGVEYDRFVRDPNSCASYYLCRNDRAIYGQCQDGLHFDYDYQMCRYKEVVNCEVTTPAPTTTPEGPIENWVCIGREHNSFCGDPRRCGSFFLCQNGIGRGGNCPHRHWFHPIFSYCTTPGSFCTPRENTCDNGIDNHGRHCVEETETTTTTTTEATTTTTEVTTTTTEEPSGPLELWVCIGRPNHSFRNHPHRCGSYFLCRNSIGIMGDCPRRHWFHPTEHHCTNPGTFCSPSVEVECDNGVDAQGRHCEGDRETTTTTEVTTTTTTEVTTTEEPSGPLELWVCIGRPDNSFRNHPRRCGSYFLCRNSIGIMADCPRRHWFHPLLLHCATPGTFCAPSIEVECDNGIDSNGQHCEGDRETTTEVTTTTTTESTTTTEMTTTEPEGPIEMWVCVGFPNNSFRGHPRLCGSFFICLSNVGFIRTCPRRSWFNPLLSTCVDPGDFCTQRPDIPCDNGVGPDCPMTSSEENVSGETGETTPRPDECDDSDSNESKCQSGENGRGICQGRDNLDVVANPLNCGTFFLCMYEIGLPVECPFGMWFNSSRKICESPGSFCSTILECDNGVGNCLTTTTEDPLITPSHSTDNVFQVTESM